MGTLVDMVGRKQGRLTVVSRTANTGTRASWNCVCDCGNEVVVDGKKLRSGHTKSCGCLHKELVAYRGKENRLPRESVDSMLAKKGVTLVSEYSSVESSAKLRCKCEHEWNVSRLANVLHSTGCPVCSKLGNGFMGSSFFGRNPHLKSAPATLYRLLLEGNGERFYKVGITRQKLSDRIKKIPYSATILSVEEGTLFEVFEREKNLKKQLKPFRHRPSVKFCGYAECFTQLEAV